MTMTGWLLLLLLPFANLSAPEEASSSPEIRPEVSMKVLPCTEVVGPDTWLVLACTFNIPDKWHIYWKNPGISGVPTEIRVEGPDGFVIKPVVYPRPQVIPDSGGITYGYEKEVTLLVPIHPPATRPDQREVEFKVSADWLVCRGACFFGEAETTIRIPWLEPAEQGAEPPPLKPWATTLLAEVYWPRPLKRRPETTAKIVDSRLIIEGRVSQVGKAGFLPDPTPGVTFSEPVQTINDGRFVLSVPFRVRLADTLGQPPLARGLLTFGDKATMPAFDVSVPINVSSSHDSSVLNEKE